MKKTKNAIRFLDLLRMGLMVMTIWGFGIIIVQAQAPNSTLTIDLSKPGHSISPILYNGVLFEEISHGVDGGFYAQLIRNGSFEDNDTLDAWSLVKAGYSAGAISGFTTTYIPEAGETGQLNSNQVHCLKFDIISVSTGSVGVANAGYWGIRLDNNTTYKVSFFAKKMLILVERSQ